VLTKTHLIKAKSLVYLLAGDEVVVSKSGKRSYGLDRFFSSIQNQVIPSLAFLNLSLISVETRKAYPLSIKQIIKNNKNGCIKDKSSDDDENSEKQKIKRKPGRPTGSGNKDKKTVELSPYLKFVQDAIKEIIGRIDKHIDVIYFVFDGAFGNNNAVVMIKQCGLHIISKLQKNSTLYFKNEEEYKGKGAPKKYGTAIDYKNIPEKYLKSTDTNEDEGCITKIYQIQMLHRKFSDMLNVVIIQRTNVKTASFSYLVLFSTDLTLGYEKIIDYYSLRFQIEFVFRDAKQYWGLEDFMNIKKTPIENWANLSTFMVNLTNGLRNNPDMAEMSTLDIKAHYHGVKYVKEVLKLLPDFDDEYLIQKVFAQIANLGAIHPSKKVA